MLIRPLRVIVTGAAGFIGSNLSQKLLQRGHTVIGIDNFSYGEERNIEAIRSHPYFTFYERDIREENCFNGIRGDVLVHLASHKIPRYSTAFATLEYNNAMIKTAVKHCLRTKAKIIFASTSDVYGKNPSVPFHETSDMVLGPTTVKRWAYATSKIYGEQYIIANHEEFGLNFTIVRFFGSYGPNQNLTWWGGPQSGFINSAFCKSPIDIHGTGKQTRTFTYIDDTVDALTRCIVDKKSDGEIFNIGTEQDAEISILSLATTIWKMINGQNSEPLINYVPYSTFGNYEDVMRRVPDISKIKKALGYVPKYDLRRGLALTIEWQKKIAAISV